MGRRKSRTTGGRGRSIEERMTKSRFEPAKNEKPRIHIFSTDSKCTQWRAAWIVNGFEPVVLPTEQSVKDFNVGRAKHWLERIKARENAPTLDGYLRWIAITLAAPESQYVFMAQPDIFPGNIQKEALVSVAISRYVSANSLVLLAGSDAIMGTKLAFLRMCDLLAGDHAMTKELATDASIVRSVQHQFPEFIIDIPSCKERGKEGFEDSPLIRGGVAMPTDFQTGFMEASKPCK